MRSVFSFFVLVLTVLTVNLLTGYITDFLLRYRGVTSPLKFTALGMIVLVIILYPAFKFLDGLVTTFAKKVMSKGNHMFGKVIGSLFIFALVIFILYCVYAHQWFGINVLKILFSRIF